MERRPIEYCYWVEPGQFLAGEYPVVKDDEAASRAKLKALTDAGVNTFIDLTAPVKLKPYAQWLDSERQTYYRFPFKHMNTPGSRATIGAILDTIDFHIAQGDVVYLHCWGVGRTGSTVTSWLVRHGYPGPAALERSSELWAECPRTRSPETEEQRQYVRHIQRQFGLLEAAHRRLWKSSSEATGRRRREEQRQYVRDWTKEEK